MLYQKKENLVFLSKYVFNFYIQDPSNQDEKFKRIQVRNLMQILNDKGLDEKKLHNTINNLKNSSISLDFYVDENLKQNTFYSSKNEKLLLSKDFFNQPQEVIFRSLSILIKFIGKKHYATRGKKLIKIIELIKNKQSFKVTLGNCVLERINQTVIISKET